MRTTDEEQLARIVQHLKEHVVREAELKLAAAVTLTSVELVLRLEQAFGVRLGDAVPRAEIARTTAEAA